MFRLLFEGARVSLCLNIGLRCEISEVLFKKISSSSTCCKLLRSGEGLHKLQRLREVFVLRYWLHMAYFCFCTLHDFKTQKTCVVQAMSIWSCSVMISSKLQSWAFVFVGTCHPWQEARHACNCAEGNGREVFAKNFLGMDPDSAVMSQEFQTKGCNIGWNWDVASHYGTHSFCFSARLPLTIIASRKRCRATIKRWGKPVLNGS